MVNGLNYNVFVFAKNYKFKSPQMFDCVVFAIGGGAAAGRGGTNNRGGGGSGYLEVYEGKIN